MSHSLSHPTKSFVPTQTHCCLPGIWWARATTPFSLPQWPFSPSSFMSLHCSFFLRMLLSWQMTTLPASFLPGLLRVCNNCVITALCFCFHSVSNCQCEDQRIARGSQFSFHQQVLGWNAGLEVWWQEPLPTEPSLWFPHSPVTSWGLRGGAEEGNAELGKAQFCP